MKRTILFLLCSTTVIFSISGQNINQLITQGVALKNAYNEEAALVKFNAALKIDPNNFDAVWNASYCTAILGNRQATSSEQADWFKRADELADQALQLNSTSTDANYVKALAVGRLALISDTRTKIELSRDVKTFSELAIKYDKGNEKAWHTLGRWHYEVKELGATKMVLIKLIYGGLPKASYESAVECFKKAISLKPDYILYYLDLAHAYDELNEDEKAILILNKALALSPESPDDPGRLEECRQLLDDLK